MGLVELLGSLSWHAFQVIFNFIFQIYMRTEPLVSSLVEVYYCFAKRHLNSLILTCNPLACSTIMKILIWIGSHNQRAQFKS